MRGRGRENQSHALSHQMETTVPLRKGVEEEGKKW